MTKKSDAPAIRFKGFSGAWEQRKLGDVVQITMGQSPDGSTYSDEPSDYILVQGNADLQNGWVCPRIWTTQITKKADAGDLIMSVRAPAGAMGKTAYNAVIGRGVAAIKGNEFIYQLLVKMDADGFWKTLSCGSTFESLNSDNIKNAEVKIPTTAEQIKIGGFFQYLDNLITLHQRKFEKLTNVKKSMLEKMFPQNGSSYPEIRFKGFTDPWEQRKFEEIAVRSSVICSDDTLPRVEYEDIVSGTGRLNKDIYAKQSIKSGIAFHQGDVLYGKLRPYLQNWLLPTFDGLAVGDFWVLQPQNADSSFLYRLIQSRQFDEVANQSTGTKMPRADWKLVSKTVFSIPSNISEQAAIGTYFTALDSLITLHQRQPFSHSTPDISLSVQLIHPFYTSSWEQRKLGDIGKARSGVGFPDTDQGGVTGVPFFKVSDMNLDGNENEMIVANNYVTAEQIADHRWSPITELPAIFFAKVGAAVMLNRKRLCRFPFLLDNNTMAYSLSPTKWDADFAKALFGTVDLTSLVQVGALPSYNAGDVESMGIYLPSLFEQEQIGAFFKLLDNLITLHQRKGKAAVSGCSNVANNSKGVCCKARDFGYKCHKKDESK